MPKCSTSKGVVVIDGLAATVAVVVALSLVANNEPAGALIPAGIGAAYLGGAVHGSRAVDECRAAQSDWEGEVAARDTLAHTPPPQRSVEEEITGEAAPPPKKTRPVQPPPVQVAPPSPDADVTPATEETEAATAPVQQPPVPVQQPPVQQPPVKKKMPPSRPAPSDDEWSDFWREVQ